MRPGAVGGPHGAGRRSLLLALVLAALCVQPGCADAPKPPSVLLVTIDTLRADAVGAWGAEPGTTPNLDALAAAGTRFMDATTVTPLTLPAHASMLTGLRPSRHGLTVNGVARPSLPAPTLAARLHAAGYRTAAFVSAAVLASEHGLDKGFELYDDDLHRPGGPPRPQERRGDRTVDRALEWVREQAHGPHHAEPWFAWVHLFDPHAPYAAPDGQPGKDRSAYLDEVRWVDKQLGRLLAGLPDGRVLVVVTSDHGESLGEHGESTHGVLMYQGAMHVPLVMAWVGSEQGATPGFPLPGGVRDDVVSVLDVAPTILEVLGQAGLELTPHEGDQETDGRSVVRPALDRVVPLECRSPAFYYGFSALAGVRLGSWKLVGAVQASPAGWRLNDLAADPTEERGETVTDHPLVQRVESPVPSEEAQVIAHLDELRELGYVGATTPDALSGPRRDPRDAMDLVDAVDAANTLLVEGQPSRAWDRLAALPAGYDDVSELRLFRGKVLRALGRPAEAARELGTAHVLQPESASTLVEWGRALLEVGGGAEESGVAYPEAQAAFEQALRLVPGDTEAVSMWALSRILQGAPDDALLRLDTALEQHPRAVNLTLIRVRALRALGREDEARLAEAALGGQTPSGQ